MTTFRPTGYRFDDTALARFMADHGYGTLAGLQAASVADPARFWRDVAARVGLTFTRPYSQVVDLSRGQPWPRFFVDGQVDLFDDLLGKHARQTPERVALRWESEAGDTRVLSYRELHLEASRLAGGLAALGVGPGDRVAVYLPMVPEAAAVLLATARLGALAMPLFSGYGADAVAGRVQDGEASVLICAEGFSRRGKPVDMLGEARRAAARCPTLRSLLVVGRPELGLAHDSAPARVPELDYRTLVERAAPLVGPSPRDAEAELMLIYTSGTTGRPKGVVHTHSGFPLKAAEDLLMAFDLGPDDTLCWVTDMGWMMGPWLVYGGLLLGSTIVLYEGTPDFPHPDRLWRLVERHRITHLGLSPTLVRLLMAAGDQWLGPERLASLELFGSTGEPWNEVPWRWLFETVGEGKRPIINYSGGTEIGGGILGCFPGLPLEPGAFCGPLPGIAADVARADGEKAACGEVGELVIRNVWPGMAKGFWRDDARYLEAYWSRIPDVWVHGDWVRTSPEGHWFVQGRSDDTIKVAGKRVGPSEYESALVAHPLVVEAVAIGVPDELKGESAVCFVTVAGEAPGGGGWRESERALQAFVGAALGKPLMPKHVHLVTALPKTKNGKVLRRLVKSAYLGQALGDVTSLDDAGCLEAIRRCGPEAHSLGPAGPST